MTVRLNTGIHDDSAGKIPASSSVSPGNSYSDSPTALLVAPGPGLRHGAGVAVEWPSEERHKLEEGLTRYANESRVNKYGKIASLLQENKTMRDVAFRSRFLAVRSQRKVKDQELATAHSITQNCDVQSEDMLSGVSSTTKHLLEENIQIFDQISTNLSTLMFQENIDLFIRSHRNILAILESMRNMTVNINQLPPLPLLLTEELWNDNLLHFSQPTLDSIDMPGNFVPSQNLQNYQLPNQLPNCQYQV